MALPGESHSREIRSKINRSMKTSSLEYSTVACSYSSAPDNILFNNVNKLKTNRYFWIIYILQNSVHLSIKALSIPKDFFKEHYN